MMGRAGPRGERGSSGSDGSPGIPGSQGSPGNDVRYRLVTHTALEPERLYSTVNPPDNATPSLFDVTEDRGQRRSLAPSALLNNAVFNYLP